MWMVTLWSRNHIKQGHITLHPSGIPHGPAPGAYERNIGQTKTEELAVMIDTFKPLGLTKQAMMIDDGNYYKILARITHDKNEGSNSIWYIPSRQPA